MALISAVHTKRLIPDFEKESWFDVRPICAGDFEGHPTDAPEITISINLLASLITAWSYEEPVSRENVARLDVDTFIWLQGALTTASGIRSNDEKKGSGNNSSSRQQRREKVSLVSSGI